MPPLHSSLPFERWRMFRSRLQWAYEKTFPRFDELYISFPIAAWWILSGSIELKGSDGQQEIFPSGHWVFPRAGGGNLHFEPNTHIISIRFKAEWFHGVSIFNREKTILFSAQDCVLNEPARNLVKYIQDLSGADLSGTPVSGEFSEFLKLGPIFSEWILVYYETLIAQGASFQSLEGMTDKVHLALEFMEHRSFAEPLHTVELAEHIGISVSQLNKLFMQEIKMTPAMIWNRRKLARAKEELSHGAESIKAIGYQLGYSSPAHFSHWFKTNTQLTPTEFRVKHGNDYRFL